MRRIQFFEFEDLPWFPHTVRQGMVDWLGFMGNLTPRPYGGFVAKLRAAMQASGQTRIIDLCSGGTGPVRTIQRLLREQEGYPVQVLMTDLYPNVAAFERAKRLTGGALDYVPAPVDATAVPRELAGFRLMCNAFHHFPPELGTRILADAVASRQGIAIFEVAERSVPGMLAMLLSPLTVLAATPFIRPFRVSRLALTYAVPAIPLFCLFDGMVSSLRVYYPDELTEIAAAAEGGRGGYHWDIGRLRVPGTPARVTYLIGQPAGG